MLENSRNKFAKNILIVGATNVLQALTGIILLSLISKTLGSSDYGIWAQMQATISLVLGLVGLGLPYAMTRFLPAKRDRGEIQEEFYSSFCLIFLATLLVSGALVFFAHPIAEAFFDGATNVIRVMGITILVYSMSMAILGLFRSFLQMKRYSLFIALDLLGQIGVVAVLVSTGHGLFSIVLAILAIRVAIFLVLIFLIVKQIGFKVPRFHGIKEYLSFGLPTVPANISAWVVNSCDRYVIAFFLGSDAVGVYSAAYGLGSILLMAATVLGFVLPPTLSLLYDEGRISEVQTYLSYSLKYFLAIAIPFVLGSIVMGKPVLTLFATADIASRGYYIVPLIALSVLFYGTFVIMAHILVVVKRTKMIGFIEIIAAIFNLVSNILVVPHWGILGAALATLGAYMLALGIGSFFSLKELKFHIDWVFIIKSSFAAGIMVLLIWLVNPRSNLMTILMLIMGVATYGTILYLLRGFKKEEIAFAKALMRRRPAAD